MISVRSTCLSSLFIACLLVYFPLRIFIYFFSVGTQALIIVKETKHLHLENWISFFFFVKGNFVTFLWFSHFDLISHQQ